MKKTFGLFLISSLACLPIACNSAGKSDAKPPAVVRGLSVMTLQSVPTPKVLSVTGTVEAFDVSPVAARMMAPVLSVSVHAGDVVHRGEVLVRLDNAQQQQALQQAQAALAGAQQMELAAQTGDHLAQVTEARFTKLYATKSISPQEYDEVQTKAKAASAQLDMARAQVKQAEAAVAQAHTAVGYSVLTAPYDGVVTARMIDPGAMAAPGMPLLTVENAGRYRFAVNVDASQMASIHVGSKVTVVVDGASATRMPVTVTQVVAASDPSTRTVLVKADLPKTPGMRSGLYGHAEFPLGMGPVLAVPVSAIVHRGSLTGVYALDAQQVASLRYVTLGDVKDGQVEVLAGLQPGDVIVVAPGGADLAGERIEVQ
jgi:RND family efflux transporter MFP subunit